ncbi:MAG TPA: hypothetical protein VK206_28010 [Anaerolineales bacterium]|nr:hypothetical protein [Anaerolineales bacterium]HLO31832.1 hypothetical protein [Anaerolineales bacterium]
MKNKSRIFLAIVCLALTALACQALSGTGTSKALFSDDFSSSNSKWGTGTDKDSSIEYADEALQMIVYTKNWFVWSKPNDQDYQNIHLEATVKNNGTDATTAFGILCNKQKSTSNFYYVAITPAGEYAIAKATDGQTDLFLTNNDQWATSDAIAKNAASYRVGADCGNGTLTLYVDGQQIASVSDTTYTSGSVGLLTWSGENATTTNVSFDDFLIQKLP